jgi:hypothetical protein|tara:strand:+ start:10118 stop:10657 length:540 start_codon:yes stop_codon:yes gene_type:complete
MANVNDPNGFTPSYHLTGGTIRPSEFPIASGATGDIFSGDVVKLASGLVLQGGASDAPLGVFYGVQYTKTDGEVVFSRKWPTTQTTLGSANAKAYVFSDPDIVYEAQYTGTPSQTDVGKVHTISTTAGDTNNNRSKEGVTTTTASGIAKQVGWVDRPDNSVAQYARGYFIFPASTFGND